MTPPINAAEIERLARLATPGPWKFNDLSSPDFFRYEVRGPERFDSNGNDSNFFHFTEHRGDAAFIASANPQTILTLIAALREATGALEHYSLTVPPTSVISEEQVKFHSEYGYGGKATKTLRSIAEKVEGL